MIADRHVISFRCAATDRVGESVDLVQIDVRR
jgi:hypothetical protein